ncbi:hypothetical protein TgHK011_008907 [Trichoderma gracile]|nr:hypothetical protein TgHK011_008907 [Trichoderma gracile]
MLTKSRCMITSPNQQDRQSSACSAWSLRPIALCSVVSRGQAPPSPAPSQRPERPGAACISGISTDTPGLCSGLMRRTRSPAYGTRSFRPPLVQPSFRASSPSSSSSSSRNAMQRKRLSAKAVLSMSASSPPIDP